MNKKILLIFFIIIIFLVPSNKEWVFASDEKSQVNLDVISVCGNGLCEPASTETAQNCPTDCGCNNNGICQTARRENSTNCPLDCPFVPPAPGGGIVFDTTPPIIFNLFIKQITLNSAVISWETNELTFCQTQWGGTPEYKDGSIAETIFGLKHSATLGNISPATLYHFKITCKDTNKNESETLDQQFVTLTPPDFTPPANASEFVAIPDNEQITLTWENPPDYDFKGVRIVRSENFYPTNPWEGKVIYDNKGVSFTDTGLKNGVLYYYTIFAYDKSNNYASGSSVPGIPGKGVPLIISPCLPPVTTPPPSGMKDLLIKNFSFFQDNQKIQIADNDVVKAQVEKLLKVSIDYKKIYKEVENLILIIKKEDKFYYYFLQVNKNRTTYETEFFLKKEGAYSFSIMALGKDDQAIKETFGQFLMGKIVAPLKATIPWYQRLPIFLIILIFSILLFILFYIIIKRRLDNRKHPPAMPSA